MLAGGASSRFGSDKALFQVEGKPMIIRAVELASSVADRVLVVGREPPAALPPGVRHLRDDQSLPCGGPVRGLVTASGEIEDEEVIVVPVDMPFLRPAAVHALLEALGSSGLASVLLSRGSVAANLLSARADALRRSVELTCLKASLGLKVRMTDIIRGSEGALLLGSGLLGGGRQFVDVDFPSDLSLRPPRGPRRALRLEGTGERYRRFIELLREGLKGKAVRELMDEARAYRALRVRLLELHALLDAQSLGAAQGPRASRLRELLGK